MSVRLLQASVLLGTFGGSILLAQGSGLSGPLSGFLFDPPSQSVRLVRGALGATTLDSAVLESVSFASVAPAGDHAIVCRGSDCFAAANLGSIQLEPMPAIPGTPEGVAWSGDGSVAVLYSRTAGWLYGVKGFDSTLEDSLRLTLPGNTGALISVGVSAKGEHIAIGISGDQGGIFEVNAAGGLAPLSDQRNAVALAFGPAPDVLYALDGAAPAILKIQLPGGLAERWDLALMDPVAIGVALDSSRLLTLYVAGRADQALLALDAATGELRERIDLSFSPTQVAPLGEGLLLTSRTGPESLLWSYVPSRGTYFIPAPKEEAVPQQQRRR